MVGLKKLNLSQNVGVWVWIYALATLQSVGIRKPANPHTKHFWQFLTEKRNNSVIIISWLCVCSFMLSSFYFLSCFMKHVLL